MIVIVQFIVFIGKKKKYRNIEIFICTVYTVHRIKKICVHIHYKIYIKCISTFCIFYTVF